MPKRATRQQILISLGMLVAIAAAGFWWGPHIWWSYLVSRNNLKLEPVKVVEMSQVAPRSGWFACRVGALSFDLPPVLAEEAQRSVSKKTAQTLMLATSGHEVEFMVPFRLPEGVPSRFEQIAAEIELSPIQFIVESYRSGIKDFRWTMSHRELVKHKKLLDLSTMYPHSQVYRVETWSTDNQEGLLVIHESRSQAMFEWRLRSGRATSFVKFTSTKGALDLDDIRRCCQSLACDESKLGPELSEDQLAVLADAMTIELDVRPLDKARPDAAGER